MADRKRNISLSAAAIVTFAVACVCTGTTDLAETETPTSPPVASALTESPVIEQTEEPEAGQPTEVPPSEDVSPSVDPSPMIPIIPGLQPVDVTLNLDERGFECSDPEAPGEVYIRTCERESLDYLLRVDVYSPSLFTVDSIDASALFFGEPDDALAADYLGFIATLPYEGSDPQVARQWVEETLPTITQSGDVREKTIGDVTFELFGPPTARNLQIAVSEAFE